MSYSILSDDALKYALLSLQKEIAAKANEYIEKVDPTVEVDTLQIVKPYFFEGLKIKLELIKK